MHWGTFIWAFFSLVGQKLVGWENIRVSLRCITLCECSLCLCQHVSSGSTVRTSFCLRPAEVPANRQTTHWTCQSSLAEPFHRQRVGSNTKTCTNVCLYTHSVIKGLIIFQGGSSWQEHSPQSGHYTHCKCCSWTPQQQPWILSICEHRPTFLQRHDRGLLRCGGWWCNRFHS